MSIRRSIESLPRADRPEGNLPARNNFVAEAVAQRWFEKNPLGHLDHAIPEAGPYRASWTAKRCDRALQYALQDKEPTNPPGIADAWRFGLGTTVHEMLQEILVDLFPDEGDVEIEKVIDLRPIGIPGSSHADVVMMYRGKRTLVEIKSINGFGFKMAATTFKGPAEGPRTGHVLQAALSAKAEGCEQIVIAYLSLEVVSANLAKSYTDSEAGRFAAEWHYTLEELEPMIETETKRIQQLVECIDAKPVPRRLVDPEYPEGAVVTDPSSGLWVVADGRSVVDTGDTWMCAYCEQKDRCIQDGA